MTRRLIASLFLTAFLAACAANGDGTYGQAGTSSPINKQAMGGVGGAVLGGLAGSAFGKGEGRLWTTGAGVLLGALAGSSVGASLDKADQMYANRAFTQAAAAPVGQQITWSNPETGNSGTYTTTRTGRTASGSQCREFTQTIMIGGQAKQGVGTACQNPDGSWQIQG
jgi:surface antigen